MLEFIKQWLDNDKSLQFETAILNNIGGRDNLEDAVGFTLQSPHSVCWVLADGVGGQGAGEVAAQLAVETVLQAFKANPDCNAEYLRDILDTAHQAIVSARHTHPEAASMATTIAVMLVNNDRAVWGHVGDSRLYHFRANKQVYRTEDQSLVNMLLARGALKEQDVENFAKRHVILQALGKDPYPEFCIQDAQKLKAGDGFLLCSDGVWELLNDDELLTLWIKSNSAQSWLQNLEKAIKTKVAEQALQGKQADNYTAIVIKVLAADADIF